ncbi:MAG: ATP12 family protein [Rhizobiaceae bacterium]
MRELLNNLEEDAGKDPERLAREHAKRPLPKRFYKTAAVVEAGEGGFAVALDGRMVKTPARATLALPTAVAAGLIADEFGAQKDRINPATMPATRLANTAIDGVAADPQAVLEDVLRFVSSDLLCYRAGTPKELVRRQAAAWDRVLDLVCDRYGARFVLSEGVMHVEQPGEAVAAIGVALGRHQHPLALAALHSMTSLTGSALLALSVADGLITADEAWSAAHVDEDWNISQWGEDADAAARRKFRRGEMMAAAGLLAALAAS